MTNFEPDSAQITATGHRQLSLEAARMAEFVFYPKTTEAITFVEQLTTHTLQYEAMSSIRHRARQVHAVKSFRLAVGAFAADLLHHGRNETAEGFMYRSSDKDALGRTHVSVRSFEQLTKFWQDMGLMEVTGFFRAKETWEENEIGAYLGRTKRYRGTEKLFEFAEGFGIVASNVKDHFEKQMGRLSPVLVRGKRTPRNGKKAQPVTVKVKGPKFDFEVSRISEINHYLSLSKFDLGEAPWVYRVFNRGEDKGFNFNQGGRLYCRSECNWQQMKGEDRSLITWGGEPTVEIDIRSSHMFILYALHTKYVVPNGDHYSIPDVEREVVKGLITSYLGKGSAPTRWPKDLAAKFFEEYGVKLGKAHSLSKVISAVEAKHPVLSEVRPSSMDWGKLQFLESECFVEAMLELGRSYGVAALPVHDSLIVAKRYADIATSVLMQAYGRQFGRIPDVRIKEGVGYAI